MCRHTQAFALLHNHISSLAFPAADICLTKKADTCTSSFCMLLSVSLSLPSRQNSLTGGWGSPQDVGLGDYLWHPFRRVPRKPAAPQGGGCLPPLPVLSPTYVNEGNWFIFQSVSPEGNLSVHTPSADLVTNFTTAVQSCGDFRPSSPNPLHKMLCGELFWLPTSGTAWVQCVCWPASNHLPSCWGRSILWLQSTLLSYSLKYFLLSI